jgi:hypothetical protein
MHHVVAYAFAVFRVMPENPKRVAIEPIKAIARAKP